MTGLGHRLMRTGVAVTGLGCGVMHTGVAVTGLGCGVMHTGMTVTGLRCRMVHAGMHRMRRHGHTVVVVPLCQQRQCRDKSQSDEGFCHVV